jgi:hypothetical protein
VQPGVGTIIPDGIGIIGPDTIISVFFFPVRSGIVKVFVSVDPISSGIVKILVSVDPIRSGMVERYGFNYLCATFSRQLLKT